MSGVKHNVSNAPTGNPLVDGVIAGGTIWDPAQGPVKVASYNKTTVSADWDSLMQSRNGVPSEVITDRSLTRYWTGSQGESMYNAAAAFEAVSGIKFERVATHTDADILWFAAGFLGVHAKSGGLPFLGEGPSDVHQTWAISPTTAPTTRAARPTAAGISGGPTIPRAASASRISSRSLPRPSASRSRPATRTARPIA